MRRLTVVCLLFGVVLCVHARGSSRAMRRHSSPVLHTPGTAARQRPAPQIPGAFRTAITLVPLDVRVIDRDGRPVTDLKQGDFTILEDGVPQEIAHFEAHTLKPQARAAAAGDEPEAPLMRKPPGFDIAAQDHRTFLIVLGRGRLREPSKGVEAMIHFVRERLLPQDLVAVFAWNRATDFTTDHEKVAKVLERFDTAHENIEGRLAFHFSSLAAAYGSKKIPAEIQGKIDEVFALGRAGKPGADEEVSAKPGGEIASRHLLPGGISDSERLDRDAARVAGDLLSAGTDMNNDLPFEEFVAENARTMQDLGNVYAGIEYLRFIEGEKHLVLVTEKGLFLPRVEDDERIAEAAATARVVIDTVQTGGLFIGWSPTANGGPTPGQWSQFWSFVSLRNIAELTGGRSSVAAYARAAVDNIDITTRAGYLLGYYPNNMKWDGRYRKIRVKVNRRDVTVLYRHGYEATDQLVPFDRQAFLTFNRIISAALYPDEVRDVRVKAKATLTNGAGPGPGGEVPASGRRVQVDITIDAATVKFSLDEEKRHVARVNVAVLGADSRGRIVDERWQTIDLALDDAQYEKCRRDGIRYSTTVAHQVKVASRDDVAPGDGAPARRSDRDVQAVAKSGRVIEVKVIAYDYAADTLGSVVARVF